MNFIDMHVHPPVEAMMTGAFGPFIPGLEQVFGRSFPVMSTSDIAESYRRQGGRAVLLAWDAETATGQRALPSTAVAKMVVQHPDVFIGFGSVDPHKGQAAVSGTYEAHRLGLLGLKFHPSAQVFSPNDRMAYPVFEVAEHLGLICLFHTGVTALGRGMRGGGGIRHRHADPMLLDDLAADFPDLTIVMAHPSAPWQDEALAVAIHKPNVYIELSGWSPKYLSDNLLAAIAGPLKHKTLFGTDFPFLTAEKWLRDWYSLEFADDVTEAVLLGNAEELLGLSASVT